MHPWPASGRSAAGRPPWRGCRSGLAHPVAARLSSHALGVLGLLALPVPSALAVAPSCDAAQRFTLKNGIEVVLLTSTALPSVALVSSIHAGTRNDPPGYEGLAHYVEHLTFREALPFASAMDLYDEAGATEVNGTTNADTTDYYAMLPAAQLERGLWVEARRLEMGLALVDEKAARAERQVVLRELSLRHGFAPHANLLAATYQALYPEHHPYHLMFATRESTSELSLDDARWFFGQYYRPSRLRLVLVGDFRPELALRLIERDFGGLGPVSVRTGERTVPELECDRYGRQAPAPSSHRIVLRSAIRREQLELYWPLTPGESPDAGRAALTQLRGTLRDVLQQAGLAQDVDAGLLPYELGGYWTLRIDVVPGKALDRVEPVIRQVLARLASTRASPAELAAQSQAAELWQAIDDTRLLTRALRLARRECSALPCSAPGRRVAQPESSVLGRFAPENALIIERRFDPDASDQGEIERVP